MRGFCTALLIVLALAGCGNGAGNPQATSDPEFTTQEAVGAGGLLPGLPAGDTPVDTVSSAMLQLVTGSFTWDKSANANVNGTTLELLAGPLDYSWALYSFEVGGYEVSSLRIDSEMTDPENCWYVFADYDNNHWILVNAAATSADDIFMPQHQLRSPGGTFYFGLICYGSTAAIHTVTAVVPRTDWVSHVVVAGTPNHYPARLGGVAQIGGNIYVAYGVYDNTDGPKNEIRLARSTVEDPQLSTQWTFSGVYAPGPYLIDTLVFAKVAERPAVAWILYDDQSLWYARTATLEPTGLPDWVHIPLGNVDYIGLLDMTEVDGRPALVYANQNGSLNLVMHYAYANTAQPGSPLDWVNTEALEALTFEFDNLELRQVNGTAALAFNSRSGPHFIYVYCDSTEPAGTTNWIGTLLHAYTPHVNGNLPSISLAQVGDNPAALYQSRTLGLMFATAIAPLPLGGDDWSAHQLTDDVFNAQSLAHTGEGWLACCVDNAGKLKTFLSTTDEPAYRRDWREGTAADMGTRFKSLGAVSTANGTPVVFYIDESDNSLKCARYAGM